MQLIASHAHELEKLENNLERQRQQLAVCERLAERKKHLLADQKQKQTVELATELLEQKELGEVRSNVVKQAERKEMIDGIREQKAANAEKLIKSVSQGHKSVWNYDTENHQYLFCFCCCFGVFFCTLKKTPTEILLWDIYKGNHILIMTLKYFCCCSVTLKSHWKILNHTKKITIAHFFCYKDFQRYSTFFSVIFSVMISWGMYISQNE